MYRFRPHVAQAIAWILQDTIRNLFGEWPWCGQSLTMTNACVIEEANIVGLGPTWATAATAMSAWERDPSQEGQGLFKRFFEISGT